MAHVLVIGASGGIGRETLSAALDAGHRVRAFSRSANEIDLENSYLKKHSGDAMNEAGIDAALDGIDVVVQTLGIGADELFKSVNLFSESTRILIAAMQRRNVRRLIVVTGFGAGDSREAIGCLQRIPFRLFLGRAYNDKDVQERLIKESGLDWTIVRPGILTKGARTGRYRVLVEPSQWRNGVISRADVADFIVRSIDDDGRAQQAPVLIW
ncbi:NAD(P)-dependent oxidoreductase [Methyloceanibacter sp.]|uniref:NAD(P)-dependent oxidoreductase n=1 Tax=Methyloceanibacter sp. TaxID=1965321 RepID=UPI00356A41E2